MRIYIIRHGETEYNRDGIIQGHTDVPLSDTGQKQAEKAAEFYLDQVDGDKLNIIAVYSSDLKRASQTAKAFLKRLNGKAEKFPVHYLKELREIYLGSWEGKTKLQLLEETKIAGVSLFKEWYNHPDKVVLPGMESMTTFYNRTVATLSNIMSFHLNQQPEEKDTVFIFTHGGFLSMIYNYIMGREPGNFRKLRNPNLSSIVIEIEEPVSCKELFKPQSIKEWWRTDPLKNIEM